MTGQTNRAEMLDRINTLMALGALPFAALLVLDALAAGGVNSMLVTVLEWAAKTGLVLALVLLVVAIVRKWRARGPTPYEESYSAAMLRRAVGASWVATFVVLTQFDSLFQGPGLLGVGELPLEHSGGIIAALMLAVFSLTYLGLMLTGDDSEAVDENP